MKKDDWKKIFYQSLTGFVSLALAILLFFFNSWVWGDQAVLSMAAWCIKAGDLWCGYGVSFENAV